MGCSRTHIPSLVRETLTEDLIERLVVDILEIAESLQGKHCGSVEPDLKSTRLTTHRPGAEGAMMATMSSQVLHQPDHDHGRPDKANFGDADQPGGQRQVGFSSQC